MAAFERVPGIARGVAAALTERRVRVVAQLLLLAAVVFLVLRLRSTWRESNISFGDLEWWALAAAFVVTALGVGASAFIWLAILRHLGVRTKRSWAAVFLQAQLAKYVPGSIWQFAGRATLAGAYGIPLRAVAVSLPVELAAAGVGAAAVAALLLGSWGIVLTVALVVAVAASGRTLAGRLPRRVAAPSRAATAAVPSYAGAVVLAGVGFWLTAHGVIGVAPDQLAFYTGAFAAAWVVGLIAIYAPGGIGVREAMLVAILRPRIGSADALTVAAVSRALSALVDVLLFAVAALVLRRVRSR